MILAIITLHNRQRNTTFSNTHPYTEHASKTFLFFYTRSSHLAYKLSVVAIGPRKNDIYATIHFLTPTFFTLRSRSYTTFVHKNLLSSISVSYELRVLHVSAYGFEPNHGICMEIHAHTNVGEKN